VLPVRIFRGPIGQIHELFRDAYSCSEETKMTKPKKRNRKIKYEMFHRTLMKLIEDPDDDVPIFAARHQQLQASDSLREVEDDPDDDVPIFAARHQQLQASDSLRKVEDDPDDDVPLFAARQ
jgi:hypothetical protein